MLIFLVFPLVALIVRIPLASLLGNLGGAHYDAGNYERGAALSREALQLSRDLSDTSPRRCVPRSML